MNEEKKIIEQYKPLFYEITENGATIERKQEIKNSLILAIVNAVYGYCNVNSLSLTIESLFNTNKKLLDIYYYRDMYVAIHTL